MIFIFWDTTPCNNNAVSYLLSWSSCNSCVSYPCKCWKAPNKFNDTVVWRLYQKKILKRHLYVIASVHHHHHHHYISFTELGHLLTRSSLTYLKVSSKVYHYSFCQLGSSVSLPWVIHFETFYSPGMKEMPFLNMPVQRLMVAVLQLDLPCSGPVTHSGEILTTGKSLCPACKR